MLRSALGFTLILVLILLFAVQAVTALKVENPIIRVDVMPGSSLKFTIAISINTDEPAADYAVDVVGFGQSPGGSYSPLTMAADTGPYSARTFVTVDSPLIHLEPGQRQAFNGTISIPQDVGGGGRYALISIHPTITTGSGQTSFITAMIVPVILTVKGTTLTHTGAITNLEAGEAVTGKPIQIKTTLKNTGNHHYYGAFVNVTVTGTNGNVVATASTNPSIWALIPGNEMILTVPISAALAPGTYTVKSNAKIADGMALLDTKTVSFTLSEPSASAPPTTVPPTQAVSAPPTSWSPAKVTTQGGAAVVTPEGKPTTYTPLGITTVMLALTAVFGILVMRRKG
jgi:methionine-rich copper-binding protein CopC